jgi:hypothetical protein
MLLVYCLVAVVIIALTVAIYSGTGGRAWFGSRELPDEIIGCAVQLVETEWLGDAAVTPPLAVVADHSGSNYRLEFTRPFVVDGREESFAWVRPRHAGYPVSAAARRPTFVYGSLESGRRFAAKVTVTDGKSSLHGKSTA